MQIREPPQDTNDCGTGIAEIRARVRIEQAGDPLVPAPQDNKIRPVRLLRLPKAKDLVSGVGPDDALLNFLRTHPPPAGGSGHSQGARRDPTNLSAAYDGASGNADRRDIQAHADSHPQMDLK